MCVCIHMVCVYRSEVHRPAGLGRETALDYLPGFGVKHLVRAQAVDEAVAVCPRHGNDAAVCGGEDERECILCFHRSSLCLSRSLSQSLACARPLSISLSACACALA